MKAESTDRPITNFERVMRQILAEKRMSLTEAARLLGYRTTQGFSSLLATGNPQLETLLNIADKLDVALTSLISRIEGLPFEVVRRSEEVFTVPYVPAGKMPDFVNNPSVSLHAMPRYPVAKSAFQGKPAQEPDQYVALEVVGSNMLPALPARSVVLAKSIGEKEWDHLDRGIYAILTPDEMRLAETSSDESSELVLNSTNGRYGTVHLLKDEIKYVAKVVGSLERSV
ncbi:hypothetical protein CLV58_10628 [Spirosoma oryzae]|uniref:HTH cro/C1-type domain-containing protein n=2 Tax=Spirosoma oryzae TaxID=1469603 RepID=A0A2T0T585_9BACT|nr:hypothetical protein CLV58_10628 [Spirosoma oryzae]